MLRLQLPREELPKVVHNAITSQVVVSLRVHSLRVSGGEVVPE